MPRQQSAEAPFASVVRLPEPGGHDRRAHHPAACLALMAIGLGIAGCATNPVTGESQFTLMSEAQEIELGQELDVEVRREMGLYDDPDLQQYVDGIGQRLAGLSHRPGLSWHFAVVDEPAVNAFALPGGYIYLTRGILPFLDTEAELAGVLGHEVGHVTARHSVDAYTKATGTGVGLAVLGIFVPEARPFQGLARTALDVLFLKHGRDDELQADRLGVEYAGRAGWDPRGVQGMLTTLSRLDEASSGSRGIPGWLSTHPDPADRVIRVDSVVQQTVAAREGSFLTNQAAFLQHLDGLVFGDDPEEGIVRGRRFLHAGLRFALAFPEGWTVTNSRTQVSAQQPGTEAYVVLQIVQQPQGSLRSVAEQSMANAGFGLVEGAQAEVSGLDAFVGTYRRMNQTGGVEAVARAAHIRYERNVFLLVGLANERAYREVEPVFSATIGSFRPLSRDEAASLRPNRIAFYVVREGDTWASVAARAGEGIVRASTLAIMNHSPADQPPRVGERIKIIVGG